VLGGVFWVMVRTPAANSVSPCVAGGRICVIIPAFNEEAAVGAVVRLVLHAMPTAHIVVVDDGSHDRTAEESEKAGATVLQLPVNLGIGGAVQAGYRYALRYDFDYAVQIDGDGQHDPEEAQRILDPIQQGSVDMVVGSRWLGRGDYIAPKGRRVGMRILSRIVSRGVGMELTDTTSGFRAVGRRGIELFADEYPTDFPEVETLVLATQRGLRLQEVGVRMHQRKSGASSISGLKSFYYMVRVITVLLVDSIGRKDRA
jgi:glycosyltransferase involved in cell wall biosynthesis